MQPSARVSICGARDARAPFLAAMESEIGLPCVDPMITGVGRIVDNLA